jgi:hypothetical protein
MRWLRTNRRFGSSLGLAALALQLVVSFGHIHLEGIGGGAPALSSAQPPTSQPSPVQHPANDTDDYCPICAVMHLASSSFLPDAPQLPLAFISQPIEYRDDVAFIFVTPRLAAFQARAPPLA